jgi:hypothetical protein
MKTEEIKELRDRGDTATGMLATLQAALFLSELHKERGDASGAEAARQTAASARAKLQEHLDYVDDLVRRNPL